MVRSSVIALTVLVSSFRLVAGEVSSDTVQIDFAAHTELSQEVEDGRTQHVSLGREGAVTRESPDWWNRSALLGDWGGKRSNLFLNGIDVSLLYRADNLSLVSGSNERFSTYIHNVDFTISVNGEQLFGWRGSRFVIHAINNNGGDFSRRIGHLQVASSLEAGRMTDLYRLYYEQTFFQDRLSAAIGLYNVEGEFYSTASSWVFLNSSLSVGKELSETAGAGLATFPHSSLGLRVKIMPDEKWRFAFAALQAKPRVDATPRSSERIPSLANGAFVIGELTYSSDAFEPSRPTRFGIGAWTFTNQFEEVNGMPEVPMIFYTSANHGAYVLAEHSIHAKPGSGEEGLALFLRFGLANGTIIRYDYSFSAGAVYTGLFAGRENDRLGIAVTHAINSAGYRARIHASGVALEASESVFELTYNARLTPWLVAQPDVQYIIQPGTKSDGRDLFVFGTRIGVNF